MIRSFVITPYFLESAKDNITLTNSLFEFSLVHKDDSFKEVLLLIIDNNSEFIKKYKDIASKVGGQNLRLKSFIEDFILKLNREKTDINNKNLNIDLFINDIADLKKIPKIDPQPYISFPIKEDKLKKIIQNLTQFAKKITIFDPYISQHMTNYSKTGIKQINHLIKYIDIENIEKFKISIQDSQSYKYSLRKILSLVLSNKLANNLDIKIISTIKKDDKNSFLEIIKKINNQILEIEKSQNNLNKLSLIKKKKKLYELLYSIKSELYDKNDNSIIVNKIKYIISKCFSDLGNKIEFEIINEWLKENTENRKFYKKGFLIEGDDNRQVVVDFGQGLNIYSRSEKERKIYVNGRVTRKTEHKFQLQKNPEYQIRVITNKAEKRKYSSISRFHIYEENANKIAVNS